MARRLVLGWSWLRNLLRGIVLASTLTSPVVAAPASLDLESAIALALEHNRSLVRSGRGVALATSDLDAARQRYALQIVPSVTAGGDTRGARSSAYGVSVARLWPTGTLLSAEVRRAEDEVARTRFVSISLAQPLFRRHGRLVTDEPVVAANRQLERSERALLRERAALIVAVVSTYAEVQRLVRQVAFDAEALQRARVHHRLARAQEGAGRVRRVDVLRAELRAGEAEQRALADRQRLASARLGLSELLGVEIDETTMLQRPTAPDYGVPDERTALRLALENRLDLAQVQSDAEDADRALRIASRDLQPDIALNAGWRRDIDPPVLAAPGVQPADGLFVGISGSFGGDRAAARQRVRGAEIGVQVADDSVAILEQGIAREVLEALHALRLAQTEATIATRNLEVATSQLTLARRLFASGRLDSLAVTDAESGFAAAQTQALGADHARMLRAYQLAHATGTLIEAPASLRPASRSGP